MEARPRSHSFVANNFCLPRPLHKYAGAVCVFVALAACRFVSRSQTRGAFSELAPPSSLVYPKALCPGWPDRLGLMILARYKVCSVLALGAQSSMRASLWPVFLRLPQSPRKSRPRSQRERTATLRKYLNRAAIASALHDPMT